MIDLVIDRNGNIIMIQLNKQNDINIKQDLIIIINEAPSFKSIRI